MRKRSKVVVLMALLAVVSVLTSPPSQTSASVCNMGLCITVADCWENCPSAATASCVNNGCQYTFGGPGGGGPSGGQCPEQRICRDHDDCIYGSVQGNCSNSVCVC